ncbi:MAG: anti-phage dCTP deaminase [Gallionella sp.]
MQPKAENTNIRPELIFALVGQAGVRIENYSHVLQNHLNTFGYHVIVIKLSELLRNYAGWTDAPDTSEATRITHFQKMGLNFRIHLADGAALARAAIVEIREKRAGITGSTERPAPEIAFILDQLKHPAEVELLRQVYGSSFILLAGHAPKGIRRKSLSDKFKRDQSNDRYADEKAEHIIVEDEKQDNDLGQNTRDTYPLADYFASFGRPHSENSVIRFIDLLFGHPFHTPLPDEYAMYQAHAGSLRSSDESRQVGAVIVKLTENQYKSVRDVDVVASGMNEVPRRGGGFYWQNESPDGRDQHLKYSEGIERADKIKIGVLTELIEKLQKQNLLNEKVSAPPHQLARELLKTLKGTQFMNIGEFMRTVHAEMAALIDSARRGVPVNGLSMYVTTFPCHNCAKHIIAAGLKQVIYLEPYPKSRAEELHGEEIDLEIIDGVAPNEKVAFLAFTGVAPRQYQQLFSMSRRGARNGLSLRDWEANKMAISPRYVEKNTAAAYLLAERQELEKLPVDVYKWDKNAICPVLT